MAPVKKPKHDRQKHFMLEWRTHRQRSQEAVAAMLDIDRTTYSKIERGKLPYNQDFLERLAIAFRCEPSDILSVNPLAPPPPRLIVSKIEKASPELQSRILTVVDALLKAG